jgi:glycosyltransferase involved in cell wall biosynthesis
MRIGIVTYWFNRGQAVVGRQMRSALDALGHETFVLARLTSKTFPKPFFFDSDDVWAQPRVTPGSHFNIEADEYVAWAKTNELDAVICFQNLQFAEIKGLRDIGVKTIGSFVWEAFGPDNVADALDSYDVVYSLTRCENVRYKTLGIESPYVQWGIHPELLTQDPTTSTDGKVRFYYPGGYMSARKPTIEAIEAFAQVKSDRALLLIKVQDEKKGKELQEYAANIDSRIQVIVGDFPNNQHYDLFRSADVSLAPSRWEGLGLHLFEAAAFGIPTLTNAAPPMDELVTHGQDGLLFSSTWTEERRPGVPILNPDVDSMSSCIEEILDDGRRAQLTAGTAARRAERTWDRTISDYSDVLRKAGL